MTHTMRRQCTIILLSIALLMPGIASACQLICLKTVTLFDGNLGGVTGADAKCVTEFGTGWKFPRTMTLPLSASNSGSNTALVNAIDKFTKDYNVSTQFAWLGPYRFNAATIYNCSDWGSNSSGAYGGSVSNSGTANVSYTTCDTRLPIICCNM